MTIYGSWKAATIAAAATSSAAIDLGRSYDFLEIEIPTITQAQLYLQVARKADSTYSGKLTRVGTNCYVYQDYAGYSAYGSVGLTLGCWVYATVATRAYIGLQDGVGTASSSYHTGVAGWEYLTTALTVSGSATQLRSSVCVITGNTSAYFDDITLYPTIAGVPEILTNTSFETGDPPTGWTKVGTDATWAQSTEQIRTGYKNLGEDSKTNSTTGNFSTVLKLMGWQHIKVVSTVTQAASRAIMVRGGRY